MSWIEVLPEETADGPLKEAYDAIAGQRGKLSNIMRVHSLHPESMNRHMELYLELMFSRSGLRRVERELIATVVSATNRCPYCIHHHAEALNHYWKDDARIEALTADFHTASLTPRELALAVFAEHLTIHPDKASRDHVHALREQGLDDRDILDTTLIVGYFNFVNRIALGLGVVFTEDEMRGYAY